MQNAEILYTKQTVLIAGTGQQLRTCASYRSRMIADSDCPRTGHACRRALTISRNEIIVIYSLWGVSKMRPVRSHAGRALVVQEFHLGRNTAPQVSRETGYCSAFLIVGQMSSAKAILWKKAVGVRRL